MSATTTGTMKIRGKRKDIERFLSEGIEPIGDRIERLNPEYIPPEKEITTVKLSSDRVTEVGIRVKGENGFLVRETNKNLIESEEIYFQIYEKNEDDLCYLFIKNYSVLNEISADELAPISEKYDIDMKIYAFEGFSFNQEIEIHKGTIIKDKKITFENYAWDCIDPTIGGGGVPKTIL